MKMRSGSEVPWPNWLGSTTGAPEPRSQSFSSSSSAFDGVKKSVAFRLPSGCTASRMTELPRLAGGSDPGVGSDG